MNLSLDYDETYTRDPVFWDHFIKLARDSGHKVYCVTMRYGLPSAEALEVAADLNGKVDAIFFTERKAKNNFMYEQGISINVWIDDMPTFILHDAR
ncbi:hypothetical protein D3C87_1382480 [compost metagenome]